MNERFTTEYLCYLMNRAQLDAEGDYGYLKLCEILHGTDFFPILEMDENRCSNCRRLREDFAEGMDDGVIDILNDELCASGTMMELFLVLAEKMSYEMLESRYEAGTGKWFKELLQNCGLLKMWNIAFEDDDRLVRTVQDILTTINFRKFGWDGEGGLFPLQWAKRDQRDVELVIEMNDYLEENYETF